MRAADHSLLIARPQPSRHSVDVIRAGLYRSRGVPCEGLLTVQITVRRKRTACHREGHLWLSVTHMGGSSCLSPPATDY